MNNINKEELQNEYSKLAQSYADGTRFLPRVAKIEMFWKLYPNGSIITPLPQKDALGEGIVGFCRVYGDRADMEHSLLGEGYSRRTIVSQQDINENEVDIYAAVYAESVSKALATAGINISAADVLKDVISPVSERTDAVPEELVLEDGRPVEEEIPNPAAEREPASKENTAGDSKNTNEEQATPTEEQVHIPEESPEPEVPAEDVPEIEITEPAEPNNTDAADASDEAVEADESVIPETDIPDITPEGPVEEAPAESVKEEPKSKKKKTSKDEQPSEAKKSKLVPEPIVGHPATSASSGETEASLIKETGVSYEEALNIEFQHQTRSGVLGDLLADEPSKCLLKWMGKSSSSYRKTHPESSKIAQIIVLHNSL